MDRLPAVWPPQSVYEPFLYAAFGEDPAGDPVSVLSTIARLDIDPWQEAARLDLLAPPVATEQLRSLIGKSASGAAPDAGADDAIRRLIALLPHVRDAPPRPTPEPSRAGTAPVANSMIRFFLLNMLIFGLIVGVRYLTGSGVAPVASPAATPAVLSQADAGPAPPTAAGTAPAPAGAAAGPEAREAARRPVAPSATAPK